jgi:hypothetical protein
VRLAKGCLEVATEKRTDKAAELKAIALVKEHGSIERASPRLTRLMHERPDLLTEMIPEMIPEFASLREQ